VRAIEPAVRFYCERLGFRELHADAGYALVKRDDVEIHLWAATDESWKTRAADQPPLVTGAESFLAGTASCRIRAESIDALCAAYTAAGVLHPNGPLSDKPYGLREFAVLDLDGNLITFFTPVAS
jgi:catechol 2,3-dioxygenase-like lactoylglutathione lyase family enzyme